MEKKLLFMFALSLFVLVGGIGFGAPANAAESTYLPEKSLFAPYGADTKFKIGDNVTVSNLLVTKGYWGWSYIEAWTDITEGSQYVNKTETIARIRQGENIVYERRGVVIGWGVSTEISRYFYENGRSLAPTHHLETIHRVQLKGSNEWYELQQTNSLLYGPAGIYSNSGGFHKVPN